MVSNVQETRTTQSNGADLAILSMTSDPKSFLSNDTNPSLFCTVYINQ